MDRSVSSRNTQPPPVFVAPVPPKGTVVCVTLAVGMTSGPSANTLAASASQQAPKTSLKASASD